MTTLKQLAQTTVQPATDALMEQIIKAADDVRAHDHPEPGQGEDWFCMNRTAWMGERMKFVLARLRDSEAEAAQLKAEWVQRTAAIKHALDGIPPATKVCADRHCTCHDGGRR